MDLMLYRLFKCSVERTYSQGFTSHSPCVLITRAAMSLECEINSLELTGIQALNLRQR